MTTLRQIEANRRNSTKSTGPKTEDGKKSSRGNATIHNLSGSGVVRTEEESARIAERVVQWRENFRPSDPYDDWLLDQAVMLSVRLERCWAHDLALRSLVVERAGSSWEEDRRLAAEELGARLAKQPALIAQRLRRTRQGCEWLLERWEALAALLRCGRDWTDAQRALALDLLGTPEEFRDGPTRLDPRGAEGADLRAARLVVAEAQVATLKDLRDKALLPLDESEQAAAEGGYSSEPDRAILLAMRYESASSRRMHWALNQLRARRGPEAAAEPARPRAASPPAPPSDPGTIATPTTSRRSVFPDAAKAAQPASTSQVPEPTAAPEPASRPAPADSIAPPVAATPAPSLRFDAAPEPSAVPAASKPHQTGIASLRPSSDASAGNRRQRRAQISQERRG